MLRKSNAMIEQPYNQYEMYTDVVYKLVGYTINHPEDQSYPRFHVHVSVESIHHTLDDAKRRIDELISNPDTTYSRWYCFYVSEVPFGVECYRRYDGQRRWSFTGAGRPVAYKAISSLEDKNGNREIFWGREKEDCMFKVGDVVEIPSVGNYVTLGIIWRMPIDFEFTSKRLPKEKPEEPMSFHLDDSDDCYQVISLDDEFPDHINVIDCFPPLAFQLDESYVTRLRALSESFTQQALANTQTK